MAGGVSDGRRRQAPARGADILVAEVLQSCCNRPRCVRANKVLMLRCSCCVMK